MNNSLKKNEEFKIKLYRIYKYLEDNNLDGVYLKKRSNFSWITCGGDNRIVDHSELGWSGILVTKEIVCLVTDNTEMPRIISEELGDLPIEKYEINWFKDDLSNAVIETSGSKNIASDIKIPGLKDLQSNFDRIQYQLTESEKNRFRELGRETSKCFTKIGHQIELGMSELDVASMISYELLRKNIQPQLILAAADNRISDYRHPIPTFKKMNRYIMYVAVAVKWGLNLSITRFVHFGEVPPGLKKKHNAIVNIDARLILNTRPGKKLNELFKEHTENFKKFGYPDEWKKLHQGGSASYRIRDVKPNIGTPDTEIVMVDQAYAWNPSIAGIKSEDTILINKDENEIISEDKNWPLVKVPVNRKEIYRPDILVK
jgi:Xaa-Pro aminopeptidase